MSMSEATEHACDLKRRGEVDPVQLAHAMACDNTRCSGRLQLRMGNHLLHIVCLPSSASGLNGCGDSPSQDAGQSIGRGWRALCVSRLQPVSWVFSGMVGCRPQPCSAYDNGPSLQSRQTLLRKWLKESVMRQDPNQYSGRQLNAHP
jgi:hypothetical protein